MTASVAPSALVLRSNRGRIAVIAAVSASATTMLDATIANVALPDIGAEFGADVGELQWVITGYLLTLASLILLGGALGDRYGRRRVFVTGAVWFGAASILCGLAPSLPVLVGARVLQGVGGALLTPSSLALLQASFRTDDRAPAVGMWSGLGGLAAAVGPFVGGWIIDGPGWRWAFLLNIPILTVSVLAARAFPESRDPAAAGGFDVVGAVLAAMALATLTWTLNAAPSRGAGSPAVVVAGAVSILAGVLFVLRQHRAPHPLVEPSLFRSRTFTVLNLATFALYASLGAQFLLVVYQLQVAAGWSALASGSALLPATLLMLVGSARSADLASKIGPRLQLTVGPATVAVAVLLLARFGTEVTWVRDVLPGALLFGAGLVAFVAPLTASVMASVPDERVSMASGVNNAIARTGSLAAVAVIPALSGLDAADGPAAVTEAYQRGMWMTAGLAAVAAVIAGVGLRPTAVRRSARRWTCAVDGPPLEPDPGACPLSAAGAPGHRSGPGLR